MPCLRRSIVDIFVQSVGMDCSLLEQLVSIPSMRPQSLMMKGQMSAKQSAKKNQGGSGGVGDSSRTKIHFSTFTLVKRLLCTHPCISPWLSTILSHLFLIHQWISYNMAPSSTLTAICFEYEKTCMQSLTEQQCSCSINRAEQIIFNSSCLCR